MGKPSQRNALSLQVTNGHRMDRGDTVEAFDPPLPYQPLWGLHWAILTGKESL